jgi:hypothetical protein
MTTLIEDTRQQADKHKKKHEYFNANSINVVRSKLLIGDYALLTDMSTVIDTKKDIQEIIGNVTKQHARFASECTLANSNGIQLIILIEDEKVTCIDDLNGWYNYRLKRSPKATTGKTLAKILHTMEDIYGVKFLFCKRSESGKRVVELLTDKSWMYDNYMQKLPF